MKVLYVAAEISPFARLTYTADLLRFLPASLQDKGFEIRILLPKYGSINDRRNRLHEVIRLSGIEVQVGEKTESMRIKVASIPNAKLQVYFLDNDTYFKRKGMFNNPKDETPFEDNDERLVFYNKGVLETIKKLNWKPDIIHCHDWPSGLVPMLVKTMYKDDDNFRDAKVVYNLHTPENHGLFGDSIYQLSGLNDQVDKKEIATNDQIDFVKAGIRYADYIITGNYIREEFSDIVSAYGKESRKIQGAPQDVSQKFADFYREIAGK